MGSVRRKNRGASRALRGAGSKYRNPCRMYTPYCERTCITCCQERAARPRKGAEGAPAGRGPEPAGRRKGRPGRPPAVRGFFPRKFLQCRARASNIPTCAFGEAKRARTLRAEYCEWKFEEKSQRPRHRTHQFFEPPVRPRPNAGGGAEPEPNLTEGAPREGRIRTESLILAQDERWRRA